MSSIVIILLSVALAAVALILVCQWIVFQAKLATKDEQIVEQRSLFDTQFREMCAWYEKRLAEERQNSYQAGLGSARPFALRTTKEIKGAWRKATREVVLAFVWADNEVRSLAGDIGDLEMFQISPEIKAGIKAFSMGVGKVAAAATSAVVGVPTFPLAGFGRGNE